ncbi:MAG: aspartate aminotransferase family protein [Pseudomonadales bacterium]|nr:aspartate aminotransferase family protein [Pseudomonadales bacterium]
MLATGTPHLMRTYNRLPVSFVRGAGCWLFDDTGKRYLDGLCGISVTNLGHCHPAVTRAIETQANSLLHTSNLYHIGQQESLADKLCEIGGFDRVFFSNSGAEANEAAIKLARLHAHLRGVANPQVLCFSGSFHGRTLATIAATASPAMREGFAPDTPGFLHAPFNDLQAAGDLFTSHNNIAAVLVEPVQGEGGVHIADDDFLRGLRKLCDEHDALMMLDEVQSGNARCGAYFAHQKLGDGSTVLPDVLTTAKGLGNGVPIGACLARGAAAEVLSPGKHGSTFGGNPLACAAANAVVQTIVDESLAERAAQLGAKLGALFCDSIGAHERVKTIRQRGLMIGIELNQDCGHLMAAGLERGVVINVTAGNVLRLLPPLVMNDDECTQLGEMVCELIKG